MTTATQLTVADVTAAIEAVVEEFGPNYVYDQHDEMGTCVYVNADGTPSCIVGRVLRRLYGDEALDKLQDIEGSTPSADSFRMAFPDLTYEVRQALYFAQIAQDNGESWGASLAAYKKELSND